MDARESPVEIWVLVLIPVPIPLPTPTFMSSVCSVEILVLLRHWRIFTHASPERAPPRGVVHGEPCKDV